MSSCTKISALGRPFDLGMLYDRRSDKLIPGKTLWAPDQLDKAVKTVAQPYTNSEVIAEDTFEEKTKALGVEASLKLSFLGGLVSVQGAAKYLDDRNTSSRQSRVVLKYETKIQLKQLTMEHLGRGMVQYPEVFDQGIATDIVVGILYGAKAFMIFDKEVSKDESKKEVHGSMEVLVKAVSNISIEGKGSVDMTDDQKKKTEKIQCKMYGDFRTEESPTNYEDAVRVYKRLPSLIGAKGENTVAIEVYLCPLSEIDSKGQRIVREISANFVSKTCAFQDHLQSIEAECSDLMREDVCSHFPRIKKQLSSFKDNIGRYKIFFQGKLLPLLPRIRGGGAEESELGNFLQDQEGSPFAQSRMGTWIEDKRKEMKRLQGMVSFLRETPFLSPDDVENETFDPYNNHVVCCTFRIGKEEDAQILSMDKHLNGNDEPELNNNSSPIMDDKKVIKKTRETVKQFVELKTANKDNNAVKFVATEEIVSADFNGSFVPSYISTKMENWSMTILCHRQSLKD